MDSDGQRRFDWSAFPADWREWAVIGIFIGLLAVAQLFIPRSSPAFYSALGIGAAALLARHARKTRVGRRWLARLKAALSGEPSDKPPAKKRRR